LTTDKNLHPKSTALAVARSVCHGDMFPAIPAVDYALAVSHSQLLSNQFIFHFLIHSFMHSFIHSFIAYCFVVTAVKATKNSFVYCCLNAWWTAIEQRATFHGEQYFLGRTA